MRPPRFLTRSVDLLTADGVLHPTGARQLRIGRPTVLVSRARCLFSALEIAPRASRANARSAARIFAEAQAPFERSRWTAVRTAGRIGVWWWDGAWAEAQLGAAAARVRLAPEALGQAPGQAWRVVRGLSGWDAQHWRAGGLSHSAWRRRPFDPEAWAAFVRAAGAEGPAEPPAEQAAIYTGGSARTLNAGSGIDLSLIGQAAGALLLAAGAYLAAQAIRFDLDAGRARRQAASATPASPLVDREIRGLVALKALVERPDPVVLVAKAQAVLEPYGLAIERFSATSDAITLILPRETADLIEEIAVALDRSPHFRDVRPRDDRAADRLVIEMAVEAAPPVRSPG